MSCNTRARVFLYIALVTGIISSLQYQMEVTVHDYFRHSIVRLSWSVLLELNGRKLFKINVTFSGLKISLLRGFRTRL
jgi:hypothetical protein